MRAVAYIRESTEEQDKGFSPQNQERSIREYASSHGYSIVGVYKDLMSGTSIEAREDFLRMLDDANNREFDIILIYHTSRFARNVVDSRKYKEHLREKLGIDVISVTQNFGDWNTPNSYLNEGINELFDAHYSKQLSAWVRNSLQEKRRQGNQLGKPPYGYYKKQVGFNSEKNIPLYESTWYIDQEKADIVLELFNLYATGQYSYCDLAKITNQKGHRTNTGNPFTYSSIKDILKNKTYSGFVHSPRKKYPTVPGKHESIVPEQLFEEVQAVILQRTRSQGRPSAKHRTYLLQGIAYCYRCKKRHELNPIESSTIEAKSKLYCETYPQMNSEISYYKCKVKREYQNCNQPTVRCEIIDEQVLSLLEGLIIPKDIQTEIIEALTALFDANKPEHSTLQRIKALESTKSRINTMYRLGELSDKAYEAEISSIQSEITTLKKQSNLSSTNIAQIQQERIQTTQQFLENFGLFWSQQLDMEEKRNWIQLIIKRVWVDGEKVVAIEPRDEFKEFFTEFRKHIVHPPLATPQRI